MASKANPSPGLAGSCNRRSRRPVPVLSTRKNSSMPQRKSYRRTRRWAASAVAAPSASLASSSQCSGSVSAGGCVSRTSTAQTGIGAAPRRVPGGHSSTRSTRISVRATRIFRPPRARTTTSLPVTTGATWSRRANSGPRQVWSGPATCTRCWRPVLVRSRRPTSAASSACRANKAKMSFLLSPTDSTRAAGQARPNSAACSRLRNQHWLSLVRSLRGWFDGRAHMSRLSTPKGRPSALKATPACTHQSVPRDPNGASPAIRTACEMKFRAVVSCTSRTVPSWRLRLASASRCGCRKSSSVMSGLCRNRAAAIGQVRGPIRNSSSSDSEYSTDRSGMRFRTDEVCAPHCKGISSRGWNGCEGLKRSALTGAGRRNLHGRHRARGSCRANYPAGAVASAGAAMPRSTRPTCPKHQSRRPLWTVRGGGTPFRPMSGLHGGRR